MTSEVLFLRSGPDLGSGFLRFPDLKNSLETHLENARKITDLESILRSVNDLVKDVRYSDEERSYFKRIRQRAYDRKRNLRSSICVELPIKEEPIEKETIQAPLPQEETTSMSLQTVSPTITSKASEITNTKVSFWEGIQSALDEIDGKRFAKAAPTFLALTASSVLVMWFLWLQSFALYSSSKFPQPHFAASGGLLMVVGFAAYYAFKRTKLAFLLCLYIGSYEVYFMTSGTVHDEKVGVEEGIANNPELILLKEKAEKARESYSSLKARYEDAGSGVFENAWFRTKHLEPAWSKSEATQTEYVSRLKALSHEQKDAPAQMIWLKILYRLGLVFLCMIFVHALVRKVELTFT